MELFDALRQPCAEIVVGTPDNSETFYLHKKLLCDSSSYFKAALNNGFAETTSQKITLDDEDPAVFRTFASWLYHPIIVLPPEGTDIQEEHLLKLYLFADKRGVVNLANDTITMLASCWANCRVVKSKTNWIFSEILASSKLYDLVLGTKIQFYRHISSQCSRSAQISPHRSSRKRDEIPQRALRFQSMYPLRLPLSCPRAGWSSHRGRMC
ncbi:hypothetical protein D6C95_10507 [Aureobasidium pullulans]|nr:hypothetical protein D6C95_10507 [Aureobasidium pullulans]